MRRVALRILQLFCILLAGFLVWGGWYLYTKGFTRKWRGFVSEEFHKRGLEISLRRLTLDPLHGLVAKDVKVYDSAERRGVLAVISQITLDINYANLVQGTAFLNEVDLRDAKLVLPIDPARPRGPKIEVENLNARLQLPPNHMELVFAEADIAGVHFSASGRVSNRPAAEPKGDKKSDAPAVGEQKWVAPLLEHLRSLEFRNGPPRVDLRFEGELKDLAGFSAEATVTVPSVARDGRRLEQIFAFLRYREGVATLTRLTISDEKGNLEARGTYQTKTGDADFQLRSTLDLQALAHLALSSRALDEAVFYAPPFLELSGQANLKNSKRQVVGEVALGKFGVKSVLFDGFSAKASWDGTRWAVRDARLVHRSGELSLNAVQVPGQFRAHLLSSIDPKVFIPFTSGKTAEMIGELDFPDAPRLELRVSGPSLKPELCEMEGSVQLGRSRFRGVGLERASSRITFKDRAVTYRDFKVERQEGSGTGTFAYDFGRREVRLEKIRAGVIPVDVMTWIDPRLAKDVAPYIFKNPPDCSVNGVVKLDGLPGTNLEVLVNAPRGMDYVFLKRTLSFPKISGRLLFTDGRLRIDDLVGTLYGGKVRGKLDISLKREAPWHTARIEAERVDFPSVTKLYFGYDTSKGLLSGVYEFSGKGGDARTMKGGGYLEVTNGNVFAIPILGPFSGIVNGIVPGAGYNLARKASATFTIDQGVIQNQDFLVEGQGFSMIGYGKLFFLDDKIDFNIRINAQGAPGVLLFPVSKLFEYVSDGSLSKPAWRPKRIPGF